MENNRAQVGRPKSPKLPFFRQREGTKIFSSNVKSATCAKYRITWLVHYKFIYLSQKSGAKLLSTGDSL